MGKVSFKCLYRSCGRGGVIVQTLDFTSDKKAPERLTDPRSVLNRGMDVYAQDGEVGKLDSFITDPEKDEQITHVVIRQGTLLPEYIPVPLSLIQGVDENGLYLATTRDGTKGLTHYAWPDDEAWFNDGNEDLINEDPIVEGYDEGKILSHDLALRAIVADALSKNPSTEKALIEVVNEQGIVTLIGTVENVNVRQAAETIAMHQPGVISVVNSLKVQMTS
jgi:hypothetical protein